MFVHFAVDRYAVIVPKRELYRIGVLRECTNTTNTKQHGYNTCKTCNTLFRD